MLDLTVPGACRLLADQIKADIDTVTTRDPKYSARIKPSALGGECVARLWYDFRWARKRVTTPEQQRIFDAGGAFEVPIISWLRNAGWEVIEKDPNRVGKFIEQYKVRALDGHLSGYLDGVGRHEQRTVGLWANIEAKSYNRRRFGMLQSKLTVKAVDYEYYVQACIYMMLFGLPLTVLVAVCKDDGDLHIDVFARDDETAQRALDIGNTVKTSRVRPAKVAQSAAFHMCKKCQHVGPCHLGEPVDRNCRSCVNCVAIEGGKFGCAAFNQIIPDKETIETYAATCPHYEPIL